MSALAGVDLPAAARMALADLRDRTRRYSFFVTLAATIWFASVCLPPLGARYSTVRFGEWRGIYNSAWVGGVFAVLGSLFLALPGFYLVKNALARDRATGVGAILAATPISRFTYLASKMLSNFAYLAVMTGALGAAALVLQLARGESMRIEPLALWGAMAIVVLPAMAVIGALAVLFEVVPAFRGALGNGIFFFVWIMLISMTAGLRRDAGPAALAAGDLFGAGVVVRSMATAAAPHFPDGDPLAAAQIGFNIQAADQPAETVRTFVWNGIDWTAGRIAARLFWFLAAFGIIAAAVPLFDRFDGDRGAAGSRAASAAPAPPAVAAAGSAPPGPAAAGRIGMPETTLTPLPARPGAPRLAGIVAAELRLAFKGVGRWWYIVALGLAIAGALVPTGAPRGVLLALAWLWPLPLFSAMGCRARQHGVDAILAATPRPRRAQRLGLYAAGVLVAACAGGGVLLRLLVTADLRGLAAFACGALFVPALALLLGLLSGTPRLFEALYLALWYTGPMNQVPPLDYGGFTTAGLAAGVPLIFLGVAAASLAIAFAVPARPATA